ncbi:MAG: alpha/beta fold hydrolase [Candidatus Baltobacteraceae bacterium]
MLEAQPSAAVRLSDGERTLLTQWGTSGPALLCVHGMTSSRFAWARIAEYFSNGCRVFAFDQRGHGDSARITGPMSLDQADADLQSVCENIDGEIAVLVGHSWGGSVVLRGGHTTRAARVVAIDPVIYVEPLIDWYEEYVADCDADSKLSPQDLKDEIDRRYSALGWSREDIGAKLHAVRHMTIEPLMRLHSENAVRQGGWDLRETVCAYPKPLLLALAATQESTVTAEERDWLVNAAGSNVTTVVYEEHGHSLHRTNFEQFARDLESWLKRT